MGVLGMVVVIGYSLCFIIEENNIFTGKVHNKKEEMLRK